MPFPQIFSSSVWGPHLIFASLLTIWIAFWYSGTIGAMVAIWSRSATFNHCFLVFPISIWLIWRKRRQLSNLSPKPSWFFLSVIGLTGCLWLFGFLINANVIMQLSIVGTFVATIVVFFGLPTARCLAFPLAFLFFSVPAGEVLLPFLMKATADVTVSALRLSNIPVHREGLQFVIPSGNWSVVEACSGIRYLIASITVGSLFAYLNYRSLKRRFLFLGVSILVPIVANWIRAYLIVLIGHLSNNRLATGVDHLFYGWAFFGVVLLIMFLIGAHWSETEVTPSFSSSRGLNRFVSASSFVALGFISVGAALLIAAPVVLAGSLNFPSNSLILNRAADSMPEKLNDGWKRVHGASLLDSSLADASKIFRESVYQAGKPVIGVYVSVVDNNASTAAILGALMSYLGYDVIAERRVSTTLHKTYCGEFLSHVNVVDFTAQDLETIGNSRVGQIWQFFYVDNKIVDKEYVAKIIQGVARLKGTNGTIYSLSFFNAEKDAEQILSKFLRANCSSILDFYSASTLN